MTDDMQAELERLRSWNRCSLKTATEETMMSLLERMWARIGELEKRVDEVTAKEGPLNAERWKLDELIAQLEKWRKVASGKTCVSFETLCFGASSLWHQTHRANYRKIEERPEAISRWVLKRENSVHADFPAQVLSILMKLEAERAADKARIGELEAEREWRPIDDDAMDGEAFIGGHFRDGLDEQRVVCFDANPAWPNHIWKLVDGDVTFHKDFFTHCKPLSKPPEQKP